LKGLPKIIEDQKKHTKLIYGRNIENVETKTCEGHFVNYREKGLMGQEGKERMWKWATIPKESMGM